MGNDYELPGPSKNQKKKHGCFFWGCITSVILAVVLLVVIGVGIYVSYRYIIDTAKKYTDTIPAPMPAVAMPEPQRVELRKKVEEFGKGIEARTAAEPIVLTADDLNALIDENPMLTGKAHVDIVGDKVTAKISFPVSDMKLPKPFRELDGRYLNGSATLRVSLRDGVLDVRADSIEAKGQPLPKEIMDGLKNQNLAEKSLDDPKARAAVSKLESIVVKDGKIIVTPRSASKPEASKDATKAEPAKEAAKDEASKDTAKDEASKEAPPKDATTPAKAPDEAKKPDQP